MPYTKSALDKVDEGLLQLMRDGIFIPMMISGACYIYLLSDPWIAVSSLPADLQDEAQKKLAKHRALLVLLPKDKPCIFIYVASVRVALTLLDYVSFDTPRTQVSSAAN